MSVLIRGMEMPNNCCECRLLSGFECRALLKDITEFPVADECPLVPVPPHGRLIDADEIVRYKERLVVDADKINPKIRYVVDTKYIDDAPTIIPAEESET